MLILDLLKRDVKFDNSSNHFNNSLIAALKILKMNTIFTGRSPNKFHLNKD